MANTLEIKDPAQLKALTSPRRQEILLLLERIGQASVKDIATRMALRPDSLYYHFKLLERVGLIVKSARRSSVTRSEQVYSLPADRLHVTYHLEDREASRLLYETIATVLRQTARQVRESIDAGYIRDGTRDLRGSRATAALTEKAHRELQRHLTAIDRLIESHRDERRGRVYAITQIVCPLEP